MRRRAAWVFAAALASPYGAACAADGGSEGLADFVNGRDPPAYRTLDDARRQQYELGHSLFNTQWVAAGTPRAERRDGLGPLFNADACDACHNEGARGRGFGNDSVISGPLLMQLNTRRRDDRGDPRYGHVLNTQALPGFAPEAKVLVHYTEITGKYADGTDWQLRAPRYEIAGLSQGALAASTIVSPRMPPPLFGDGLLERVPESAILAQAARERGGTRGVPAWVELDGRRRLGRFGWQALAVSVRTQTARALSREMGLSSPDIGQDDCTAAERACRTEPNGGAPEVDAAFFDALVAFQQELAVPRTAAADEVAATAGAREFAALGCEGCHQPVQPLSSAVDSTAAAAGRIAPYSDLLLHDLGPQLADRDARGKAVPSRWRTAPLWGLGHAIARGGELGLLHDGRARSAAEAILWHGGEAAQARSRYLGLDAAQRAQLDAFLRQL